MDNNTYTLAISSFAVHGTASLKTFTKVLGHRILPVPTKMLSGLTNMDLIKSFEPPFEQLLESTFEIAASRKIDLILYIGYLGYENQADIILEKIEKYQSIIKAIIVDPVSGDNGKLYVSEKIVEKWPELIQKANFVFPNNTELKLFTDWPINQEVNEEILLDDFKQRFPNAVLVGKSIETASGSIGVRVLGTEKITYGLPKIPKIYGGTGDLFLALFILNHFYKNEKLKDAIIKSVEKTHEIINDSYQQNSNDLLFNSLDSK